jgi:hypothetical protein
MLSGRDPSTILPPQCIILLRRTIQLRAGLAHQLHEISKLESRGVRGMMMNDATLDPEISELIDSAFAKSWQFVKTDPKLAHEDPDELRFDCRAAWRASPGTENGICGGSQTMQSANCVVSAIQRDAIRAP